MRNILATILPVIALFSGLNFTASAQDYEVKLTRPNKVGDRFGLVVDGSKEQHLTITIPGQNLRSQDEVMKVSLTAQAEVLAVSPAGREAKTSYKVVKSSATVGAQVTEILPAGTVFVAERAGDKTVFKVADAPVKPETAEALAVVISLSPDDGANDDDIFGTKERKKVGDSWPVNAKAAAMDLQSKAEMKVDPANLSGTTTLTEVLPTGIRIAANLKMKDLAPPLPPGFKVTSSVLEAKFSGIFPVDTAKRATHSGGGMTGKIECAGVTGGKEVKMVMTLNQEKDETFTEQ